MKSLLLILLLAVFVHAKYFVETQRVNRGQPFLTTKNSVFDYNYNAAYVPPSSRVPEGLLVRCQNNNSRVTNDIYSVTPSVLAYTKFVSDENTGSTFAVDAVTDDSVVFSPQGDDEAYGVEDPRIVYSNNTYYLLYSAVRFTATKDVQSLLSLATTTDPTQKTGWRRYGPLFPQIQWSKSGSLLVRESGLHYLFFGDSTLVPGLQAATTTDLIHYKLLPGVWLPCRKGYFDEDLVEGGPYPMKMSDGNYFMIYNSARHYRRTAKPGYDFQYNLGWVVLNGTNPLQILQRSETPILSPDLVWENGENQPWFGLTPNVVFGEGMRVYNSDIHDGADRFVIFYGGADSWLGGTVINIRSVN